MLAIDEPYIALSLNRDGRAERKALDQIIYHCILYKIVLQNQDANLHNPLQELANEC